MSAESEIYAQLIATAAVTNLVGTRAYVNHASASAAEPYVVFGLIRSEPVASSGGQVGYAHRTYAVDCVGTSHSSVDSVSAAVKTALEGYTGTTITHCGHRADSEEWIDDGTGEDRGIWVISQEWYVRTLES